VRRLLPFLLVALTVAAAAVGANLLLLGYADAGGDPVGKLSPVQPALTAPGTASQPTTTTVTTATTTSPTDDSGGRGGEGDD
jgi:hypothetical protein